jgi:hypothetical protein
MELKILHPGNLIKLIDINKDIRMDTWKNHTH